MQKKIPYIVLLIAIVVMTGCEDMFYREIDFKGDTEPEMLVLTGNFSVNQVPQVQVSHSFFFDRTDKKPNDWITDAAVSLSVNGTAYTLSYDSDIEAYTSPTLPRLQALDTVEVTATHPSYATATARQIMPAQINSTVGTVEVQANGTMKFLLNLDAYQGNADDVIGIRAKGELSSIWTRTYGGTTRTDSMLIRLNTVYSNDFVFAQAENASTQSYYGAPNYYYLYFPASELKEAKQLQFFLDSYQLRWEQHDTIVPKQLEVEVIACSYSAYRFAVSTRSSYYIKSLSVPSWLPEQQENFMEEIMEGIQEILGDQEPVQVYTNVDGGLGHVAAFSTQVHWFDF